MRSWGIELDDVGIYGAWENYESCSMKKWFGGVRNLVVPMKSCKIRLELSLVIPSARLMGQYMKQVKGTRDVDMHLTKPKPFYGIIGTASLITLGNMLSQKTYATKGMYRKRKLLIMGDMFSKVPNKI